MLDMAQKKNNNQDTFISLSDFDDDFDDLDTSGLDQNQWQGQSQGQQMQYNQNQYAYTGKDAKKAAKQAKKAAKQAKKVGQAGAGQGQAPKKKSKAKIIVIVLLLLAIGGGGAYYMYNKHQQELQLEQYNLSVYNEAIALRDSGRYAEAIEKFNSIAGYADAAEQAVDAQEMWNAEVYAQAMQLYEEQQFDKAAEMFNGLAEQEYSDSAQKAKLCIDTQRTLYIEKLGLMSYKINKYKELSNSLARIVIDTWNKAITSNGDAQKAIQELYKTREADIKKMKAGYDGLGKQIEPIVKLGGAEAAYESFQELYELYKSIHEGALDPSGEFADYKKKMVDYANEFDSLLQQMYVKEPELKAEFMRQEELERIEQLNNGERVIKEKADGTEGGEGNEGAATQSTESSEQSSEATTQQSN